MIIYKILNVINGKVYIGKTTKSLKARFEQHVSRAFNQDGYDMPLYEDMRTFGKDAFKASVVEKVKGVKSLDERERFWIKEFNSKAPNGYNLTDGGSGTLGYKHTSKDKQRMRVLKIGKYEGEKNPFYGKKHSPEQIEKWKRDRKNRSLTNEWRANISKTRKRKPVVNLDTGQVFESARHVCRYYGKDPDSGMAGNIAKVCRKVPKYKTVLGYRFEYYDPEIHDNTVPSLEFIKEGVTTIQ